MLKIFNTLTKKKETFRAINSNKVKLYVCGITVYDLCHLGHARTFIIFDMIVRYLHYFGYTVEYIRNITDIDDKIIKRACKNHETVKQLTDRMIQEMYLDLDNLNILRPTYEPKVTDYINVIINFILLLIKKKHAYITSHGDVLFSIKTAYNYGILSQQKNIKIFPYNTIHNSTFKKDSIDFVLWKSAKKGEPYWVAPWGKGRPGWHIECSAIIHKFLGKNIDIHGGGSDLIFPHHENEIVQSTCAYNINPYFYVNIWMHTGMLSVDNTKMSKSLDNFFTIREILKKYDSETVRFFLLSAHYRNQLQYNDKSLKNARLSLERLYIALRNINSVAIQSNEGKHFISKFIDKMNDDFNTPEAYSILFDMAHELNNLKNKHYIRAQGLASNLKYLANILGILYQNPDTYLKGKSFKNNSKSFDLKKIQELIQIRENARKNKQWELADKIREQLMTIGIILEDESTGNTKWKYKSYHQKYN